MKRLEIGWEGEMGEVRSTNTNELHSRGLMSGEDKI